MNTKILLLTFSLFILNFSLGQLQLDWVSDSRVQIGTGEAVILSSRSDSNGDIIVFGETFGTVDMDPNLNYLKIGEGSSWRRGLFLAKYDGNTGSPIFVNLLPCTGQLNSADYTDYGYGDQSLVLDDNDNIIITGYQQGNVELDLDPSAGVALVGNSSQSSVNVFVAKYDNQGGLIWNQTIGESMVQVQHNSTVVNSQGEVFLLGQFFGTIDFDPGVGTQNLTAVSSGESFVLKLDANGAFIDVKQSGIYFQDMSINSFDEVFLAGTFAGTHDFDLGAGVTNVSSAYSNSPDYFYAKYSSILDLLDYKIFSNTDNFPLNTRYSDPYINIDASSNGYIHISGRLTYLDLDPGPSSISSGGGWSWIATYSSSGVFLSKYNFSNSSIKIMDLASFSDGSVVVANHLIGANLAITKVDVSGGLIFNNVISNSSPNNPYSRFGSVEIGANNEIVTGGLYWGGAGAPDFDPGTGVLQLEDHGETHSGCFAKYNGASGNLIMAKSLLAYAEVQISPSPLNGYNNTYGEDQGALVRDDLGNVYVAGIVRNHGDISSSNDYIAWVSPGFYVAKYNTMGEIQWTNNFPVQTAGSSSNVSGFYAHVGGIAVNSIGEVFFTGGFPGGIYNIPPSQNGWDDRLNGFVIKLDANGDYLNSETFKPTASGNYYVMTDVEIGQLDNVYLCGYSVETVGGFFARYDGSLNNMYTKTLSSTGVYPAMVNTLDLKSNGNVVIGGGASSNTDFDPSGNVVNNGTSNFDLNGFIAEYDEFGFYQTHHYFESSGQNNPGLGVRSIAIDQNDNLAFAGNFDNEVLVDPNGLNVTHTELGGFDVFYGLINSSGIFEYSNHLASSSDIHVMDIEIDNGGNINLWGDFTAFTDFDPGVGNEYLATNAGGTDSYLARYNSVGEYIYAFNFDCWVPYDTDLDNNGVLNVFGFGSDDWNITTGSSESGSLVQYQQSILEAIATVDQDVLCSGQTTGQATVVPTGTHPPYTYAWSPSGATTATATGLSGGVHTVTVTDALGTTVTQQVTITEPTTALSGTVATQTDVTCYGGTNGSAGITASGGTSPYSYSWSPSGGSSAFASGLSAGNYTVTITDANTCTNDVSVTITEPFPLTLSLVSQTNVLCNGGTNGAATVNASGGSGSNSYSWSPIATSGPTASSLSAGTYTAQVQDLNGCLAQLNVTITEPAVLSATVGSVQNVTCASTTDGSATINVTGGVTPYQYAWQPQGGNAATANNLPVGTYNVNVMDGNGCTTSTQVQIQNLIPTQDVCVVTVDTVAADHNIVIWEKDAGVGNIDSFYIYREITTNSYQKIGAVDYSALSLYEDFTANPNSTSYKYRITALDTCGSEGSAGLYHKSIHLQYSGLGNFQWTFYEIENTSNQVASYNFWRDDLGNGNWQILQTVSGSTSSFTDVDYASYPNAIYRVDLNWIGGYQCSPTKANVNTSRSNKKGQITSPGADVVELLNGMVQSYPNPTGGDVTLVVPETMVGFNWEMRDGLGKVVSNGVIQSDKELIRMMNLATGVYFLQIPTEYGLITKKIIKN